MEAFICTGLVQQILLPKESLEALGHHRGPGHALSPQSKYNMCFNKGDPQHTSLTFSETFLVFLVPLVVFLGVKFGFRKSCLCKRNDKYKVCGAPLSYLQGQK